MTPFDGDDAAWDRQIQDIGAAHLLQGSDWGGLKARWGWSVKRFVWIDDKDSVWAAAQVMTRRISRTPFVVAYVPKGPLLVDPSDAAVWSAVLMDVAAWARRIGLTLVKIDPDVPADATAIVTAWAGGGWRRSDAPVQFPNTMVTDLTVGESALLAAMHAKTRYNIGLARRRGVTVRYAGVDGLGAFHQLYMATSRRTGFGVRARAYYLDAWSALLAAGRATVILAEREDRALAGVIPVTFGGTAWYLYGASADEGREHMPAYLAQWESLRWALGEDCRRYDWWGGPTELVASDPLWGVYRFKVGFGANWAPQVGAWDLPVRPWHWRAYRAVDVARRRVIARRRRAPAASL